MSLWGNHSQTHTSEAKSLYNVLCSKQLQPVFHEDSPSNAISNIKAAYGYFRSLELSSLWCVQSFPLLWIGCANSWLENELCATNSAVSDGKKWAYDIYMSFPPKREHINHNRKFDFFSKQNIASSCDSVVKFMGFPWKITDQGWGGRSAWQHSYWAWTSTGSQTNTKKWK